jgi:hypothetical protein
MRLVFGAAALAVLLTASASVAAPRKARAADDPDREICKSRPVVGSRVQRVRECHSAAQWEDLKLAERQGLMRAQHNGAHGEGMVEEYLPPGRSPPAPQ